MYRRSASEDEVHRLLQATGALDVYLTAVTAFVEECLSIPPTEIQHGKAYENEMVNLAFTCAGSYIYMASDHLLALQQMLASNLLPTSACYTLLRGCAEASARASWLADPAIPRWKRVKRGISERLANAEAHYKLEKDDPAYDKSRYSQRIARIQQEAVANGIPLKKPKKPGDLPQLDIEERPFMTPLMDEQLRRLLGQTQSQAWYYAYLSSYAHSALFTVFLSGTLGAVNKRGLLEVHMSADVSQILKATDPAVALHAQATRDFGLMVGRNDAPPLPTLMSID